KRTRRAGKGLLNHGIAPTHILTSPLVRARETAEILQNLFRPRLIVRICEELTPEAAPDKLFSLFDTLPQDSVVLCVGHEPHLSLAAGILLAGKPIAGLSLKKAGACLIRVEGAIRPAKGHLEWWTTAAQLRALGEPLARC
ncbi:MAG: uncharacterized protein K0S45_4311, partial [Nitrospira sp.]|nr:uncharacterized protein [Nitrospira sp.]